MGPCDCCHHELSCLPPERKLFAQGHLFHHVAGLKQQARMVGETPPLLLRGSSSQGQGWPPSFNKLHWRPGLAVLRRAATSGRHQQHLLARSLACAWALGYRPHLRTRAHWPPRRDLPSPHTVIPMPKKCCSLCARLRPSWGQENKVNPRCYPRSWEILLFTTGIGSRRSICPILTYVCLVICRK
jgi:hypothetical protein